MSLPREGSRVIREGILVSVPMDWCKSPSAIVPYKIHTECQVQGASTADSVRQTDAVSHVKGSLIRECYGDEPGVGGGVVSGTHNAECTPKTWSETVRFEDRNAVRHDDEWWMNHKNTWGKLAYTKDTNTYGTPKAKQVEPRMQWAFYQPPNTTPDVPTLPAPSPTPEPSPTPQPQPQEIPAPSRDGIARRAVTAIVGAAGAATSAVAAGILIATTTPAGKGSELRVTARERQKKCPCTVEPYSIQRKQCPVECPGSQAHHIVPDYMLGAGNRKSRESGDRIYTDKGQPLTSFGDGPAICLIGNKSSPGTPHNIAHGGDRQIQDKAASNGGVISLGEGVDISVLQALEARPECRGEILAKTYDEFGKFDPDTNVRGTNNPIKPGDQGFGRLNTTKPGSER